MRLRLVLSAAVAATAIYAAVLRDFRRRPSTGSADDASESDVTDATAGDTPGSVFLTPFAEPSASDEPAVTAFGGGRAYVDTHEAPTSRFTSRRRTSGDTMPSSRTATSRGTMAALDAAPQPTAVALGGSDAAPGRRSEPGNALGTVPGDDEAVRLTADRADEAVSRMPSSTRTHTLVDPDGSIGGAPRPEGVMVGRRFRRSDEPASRAEGERDTLAPDTDALGVSGASSHAPEDEQVPLMRPRSTGVVGHLRRLARYVEEGGAERAEPDAGPAPLPLDDAARYATPHRDCRTDDVAPVSGEAAGVVPFPVRRTVASGEFSISGIAYGPGQGTVTAITYSHPLDSAVPASCIELVVDSIANVAPGGLCVMDESGFAPNGDGFVLELLSAEAGMFAARGTYLVRASTADG